LLNCCKWLQIKRTFFRLHHYPILDCAFEARYFETMPCGPMEKETITSWSITNKTR
jgi:hypothetical protein